MDYQKNNYPIFEMFSKEWALAAAGTPERHNACTISWGSMGTLWGRPNAGGAMVTVYLHPGRYTQQFFAENDTFTVSFFPSEYKRALGYMGAHSGRDGNKEKKAGLTPVAFGDSVAYQEANLVFLCRKVYQHPFSREDIAPDIQEYYRDNPKVYPVDGQGDWQPHWVYVGEIIDVMDRRQRKEG